MRRLVAALFGFIALASPAAAQKPGTIIEERMILELHPGKLDTVVSRVTTAGMRSRTEVLRATGGIPGMKAGSIQLMNGDDSTLAITYVDTARRAYAEMRPSAMLTQMGGTIKMTSDSSADSSSVDSVGAGPVIAGHKTVHFRVRTTSRMTMVMMGDSSTRSEVTVKDVYVAPDLRDESGDKNRRDSTAMLTMENVQPDLAHIVARNRAQMRRVDLAGYPLMTESRVISTTAMGKVETHRKTEVLSYSKAKIPDWAFVVPKGYRKVGFLDLLMPN